MYGLRPREEIENLVTNACEIKTTNPGLSYQTLRKIGEGGYGTVFECKNKVTG